MPAATKRAPKTSTTRARTGDKTAKRTAAKKTAAPKPPDAEKAEEKAGPPPKPWEKQRDETLPAFAAFQHYRDAGSERSVRKTAAELEIRLTTVGEWSSKYRWVRRVEEYEMHLDAEHLAWQRLERREMAKRHVRIASAMMSKVVDRLRNLDPEKMTPTQLAQWAEVATKLERQALGGETQRITGAVELSGKVGLDVDLPEDEMALLAELKTINAALAERLGETA